MPNPLYTYILNIYDLVSFGFMAYQPLKVILCQILFIELYGEIVGFGKSYKMIKISEKVDKSNTYKGFCRNISFFIQGRKVCISFSLNNE